MNSRLFLIALGFFLFFNVTDCISQNKVERQVLSSAGHSAKRQAVYYDYTIGQTVISTLTHINNHTLTQGFQQPDKKMLIGIFNPNDAKPLLVELFPNPVSSQVQFKLPQQGEVLKASVLDAFGRLLLSQIEVENLGKTQTLDCSSFASGTYFMVFQTKTGQRLGVVPFVKI